MRVISCGYNYSHDPDYVADRSEGLEDYLLLIIRSPAYIRIKNTEHHIKGNAVIIYRKDTPQYFAADHAEFVNDWVQFQLNTKDLSFIARAEIPFDTVFEFASVTKISRIVSLMFEERWTRDNKNAEENKALLLRFLLLKLSDSIADADQPDSPLYMRLKILKYDIFESPHLDWSIDTICKRMRIGPTYLYTSYKEFFGTNIKEDVINSRLERAKHLLTTTIYNITTVSNLVGYQNDTHFMYIFKKKIGMTPSQYRRAFNTYFDYLRYNTQWSKENLPTDDHAKAKA